MSEALHFDDLRELVQNIEDSIYRGISKLAAMNTEGLNEAELRARL